MKTFFNIVSFIFIGLVVAIFVAGYISRDNRLARDAYRRELETKLQVVSTSLQDSQEKLEDLDDKFEDVVKVPTIAETKATTKKAGAKTSTKSSSASTPTKTATTLTKETVATHASASDCWIIVDKTVHSVGPYISMHPGGRSTILNVCGKDATGAFNTRGGTGSHSSGARTTLGTYSIGVLGSALSN
jgi:cytochrome b involved in lipid metabolism